MPLVSGTKLGPYEILSPLGAGGMGEVYCARDSRLERDVAIKVLSQSFASDTDRLRRFEQEARAVAALNHPNILGVYDIGQHQGLPYIVTELLDGETLRERVQEGPIGQRRAIEYASQIARGLAAAHVQGVVHRDLKPENVFVTKDGRVKILDFGLAKLARTDAPTASEGATATVPAHTMPGMVLGTAGYMSPEQVRGKEVDARTDIFALGAILYEMLSGHPAFKGDSSIERMNAILKDDPPELELKKLQLSPGLERIVRRCLEKEPSRRFQSASDLGFAIEALSGTSGSTPAQRLLPSPRKLPRLFWLAAALVLIVAAVGFLGGSKFATYKPPTFQSIAFGPGFVSSARFTPDGANVIYGAGWNGKAIDLFSTRLDGIESRAALGLPPADILAISGRGDMAILLNRHHYFQWMTIGTLALAQLSGGSARPLLENVSDADISPDGKDLAVARFDNNQQVLEFPIGKPLYRTSGWIDHPAIAPDGKQVAFLEHPVRGDDRGYVAIVAESGKVKRLTQEWVSLKGLVWSRRTDELWFSASVGGEAVAVRALSLSGRQRIVLTAPSDLLISDISSNGQVLLLTPRSISEIALRRPGQTQDRVMDFGTSAGSITGMSDDGSLVGLNYAGAGSGIDYLTYVVKTDEGELIRLGEGDASCLSPDGKWLVSFLPSTPGKMVAYPTGPGEVRHFDVGPVLNQGIYCSWMRDSKHFVFTGAESGKSLRGYLVDINTGKSRSVTPEGTSETLVSPDGRFVLARNNDGFALYPTDGAPPLPVRGMSPNELPIQWDMSGSQIYVWNRSFPARLRLINPTTGAGKTWLETMPPDPAGLLYANLFITPDGKSYAYRYRRVLSTLYLTDGLY